MARRVGEQGGCGGCTRELYGKGTSDSRIRARSRGKGLLASSSPFRRSVALVIPMPLSKDKEKTYGDR